MPSPTYLPTRQARIRIKKPLDGVFVEYQPVVGGIYEGSLRESIAHGTTGHGSFCVIQIKDKKIIIREKEMEILENERKAD